MLKSQELAEELAVKTRELFQFSEEVKQKEGGPTAEDRQEAIRRDAELNDIEDRRVQEAKYEGIEQKNRERYAALSTPVGDVGFGSPTGSRPDQMEQKSIGEALFAHANYKTALNRRDITVPLPEYDLTRIMDRKTLMSTSAGWAPPTVRTNIVIDSAQRRPVVADLIPQDSTTLSSFTYMRETTFTNNVAPVAEGGTKPESALALTPITANVRKIAGSLPITEEQLDDVPGIQAYINRRLSLQLALAEETQLLTGTGTPPALEGFLTVSGTQTQAVGSDPVPTAVYKAMNLIRSGGATPAYAEPDGIIAHPNDWVAIATLQDGVGRYIWSDPFNVGPERLWGKPVIVTPAETENTILVGDFGLYSHISRKMGATIRIYDQYDDYPIKNQLLVIVEERLSLEIYRPAAFAKVTGA